MLTGIHKSLMPGRVGKYILYDGRKKCVGSQLGTCFVVFFWCLEF